MRDDIARKRKMAKGTLLRYEDAWHRCIEPNFGDWDLADIRHLPVQAWAYTMSRGEAEHSVRVLRTILREAWAVDELIDRQPLPRTIDLPGAPPEPALVWNPEQLMAAMPLLRGTPVEEVWLVMAGGGARKEEAAALWWRDMEFVEDEGGRVCYFAIDDAVTVADGRKDVKTPRGRRTGIITEPFASRLWELRRGDDEPVSQLAVRTIPYAWHRLWERPPKRGGGERQVLPWPHARLRDGGAAAALHPAADHAPLA